MPELDIRPERSQWIPGPAGRIEARRRDPVLLDPERPVALLCHPHPLHGGSLHNKVLYRLSRSLAQELGLSSLRFNFRGVGGSEGAYDGGPGEMADTRAVLDFLHRSGTRSVVGIGFSFGAAIGLRAMLAPPAPLALVALGLPLRGEWNLDFLARPHPPRLFVQGEDDAFGPAAALESFAASLPGAVEIRLVPGADHLFTGQEDAAVAGVVGYLSRLLSP